MLPVPEQRRPPMTRRRERYETPADLQLAIAVSAASGWEIVMAVRLPDGSVEAEYAR